MNLRAFFLLVVSVILFSNPIAKAEIYQWEWIDPADHSQGKQESTTTTPSGNNPSVQPVPGADFRGHDHTMAWFRNKDLQGSNFTLANLTDADLRNADLKNVDFEGARFANVDIADADIRNASFRELLRQLMPSQIYSTASYKAGDLTGVDFSDNDLEGWDFSSQNLTDAKFTYHFGFELKGTDFSNAILTRVNWGHSPRFTQTIFSGADLSNASFGVAGGARFTDVDFSNANMQNIYFEGVRISGGTLNGADLTDTTFAELSTLTGTDLTDAVISRARFRDVPLTSSQLYSTANYKNRDLSGVSLEGIDMSSWDFSYQNLTDANFSESSLNNVDFSYANLTGVKRDSFGKDVHNANFSNAILDDSGWEKFFTFWDTNFNNTSMERAGFYLVSFRNTTFVDADLSGAVFQECDFINADLSHAILRNAKFGGSTHLGNNTNFVNAIIDGASFLGLDFFTPDQLYSTQSYKVGDLSGIKYGSEINLRGYDFIGKNLTDSGYEFTNIIEANFTRSDLRGATLTGSADKTSILINAPNTKNTIHPNGNLYGLGIGPAETMRLWDYDPDTPLPIRVTDTLEIDPTGTLKVVIEDDNWGSTLTFTSGVDVLLDGS